MYRKNKQLLNDVFDKYDRLDKSYNSLLANSSNERGFTEKRAKQIAEAMTNRRLYEVTYEDTLEKDISKILDELEI